MKTQFNGERLKKARIYRGLTVAELAEQVGCQRQTLSMYEISKSQPTDKGLVDRLSRALSFPVKFFYEHPASNTEGTVYFRSLLTTNKKYRKLYHAVEDNHFISLSPEFFSRKLLKKLYDEGAFDCEYNGYDGYDDYEFILKMFNKRDKSSITLGQQKKIRAIIVASIRPYLRNQLARKING